MAKVIPAVEIHSVDIEALRSSHTSKLPDGRDNPFEPHTAVKRFGAPWFVRQNPVMEGGAPPRWSTVRDGDLVRIPLRPYLVKSEEARDTLAYAVGVTAKAVLELSHTVTSVVVACGDVEEEYVDEHTTGYRFWLGFAAKGSR